MRLCELRQKEVINVCTCASLGCVIDVEIDKKNGCITALIVPGCSRFSSFWGRDNEIIIPWKCICQIGKDIILVELPKHEK
ncbi:MAG: YlmC/YmxH family sporulation protein [Eubacteriales bacterium]|nr:YlmC/YmxH family sporulation protein [Eubacteriales bacterium]